MELGNNETDVSPTLSVAGHGTMIGVSEHVLFYFNIYLSIVIMAVVSLLGLVANILNILVYWKLSFKDNVNITFMSLSVYDFTSCVLFNLLVAYLIMDVYFPMPNINFIGLAVVTVSYTRGLTYIFSTLVTVYLSIERCICIMFPFKVKDLFTARRVILINMSFIVFGLACVCPALATQGLQWVFDLVKNRTRLELWLSPNRHIVDMFTERFNGMVIPVLAQLLITGCSFLMINGLRKSGNFRKKSAMTPGSVSDYTRSKPIKGKKMTRGGSTKITLVVIFLAMIFFVCNLPTLVATILRGVFPDANTGKQQSSLYEILYVFVSLFTSVNASVNIFAYYYVSSKFRHELKALFRLNYSSVELS